VKYVLGVETSCDETAAAVVSQDDAVLASVVASQADFHATYGGVVPELASRSHLEAVNPVISEALQRADVGAADLEAIAVTRGPGLIGALLVGISAAKAYAWSWGLPIVGVNHLDGHLASVSLNGRQVLFPCLVLLVSGGHCLLAQVEADGEHVVLGQTVDDSVGEAYDKVARLLGLGYPGGPVIDRLAKEGRSNIKFPRPMLDEGLKFSFSGLKTAVARYVKANADVVVADVAASFADACMDVLLTKLARAARGGNARSIAVVGGVAASPVLRERLKGLEASLGVEVFVPPQGFATDNAAMIAAAGWRRLRNVGADDMSFDALPGWRFGANATI
jgi:N6-L-threonylcarbamoyladenine synthase